MHFIKLILMAVDIYKELKKYKIMIKLNKYSSDSYKTFFDNDLSLISDPDLYNSIKLELERQQQHIELIASENIVSKAVLRCSRINND